MKGDFTRFTFRPDKQYSSVRLQQGRVQLDADWNEQVDIHAYQLQTAQTAFFGDNGAPKARRRASRSAIDSQRGLTLSPGRFFVAGLLCELAPSAAMFRRWAPPTKTQPFLPGAPPLSGLTNGSYLVYSGRVDAPRHRARRPAAARGGAVGAGHHDPHSDGVAAAAPQARASRWRCWTAPTCLRGCRRRRLEDGGARTQSLAPVCRAVPCSRRARAICALTITCTASRSIKAVAWAKTR
jgi:hypothetical protein